MAIKKENRPKATFSKITIGLASPDSILERSYGEVLEDGALNSGNEVTDDVKLMVKVRVIIIWRELC